MTIEQDGSQAHPFIGVATVVVNGDLILVGHDGQKGCDSLPGGHWEQQTGESFEDAARREVFEETGGESGVKGAGVRCTDYEEFYDTTFYRDGLSMWYRSIGFTAVYASGHAADDLTELRTNWQFIRPEEALARNLFLPARMGIEAYMAKLRTAD